MGRRAVQPLNEAARKAANAELAKITGGRKLTMGPKDAALRKKWMDAYEAAGGEVVHTGKSHKKPKKCVHDCPHEKTVTGTIASVTFRSDHLDGSGDKLIKKAVEENVKITQWEKVFEVKTDPAGDLVFKDYTSKFGDTFENFMKPEWSAARGGSSDSHPVSHPRDEHVKVDIEIDFTVTPERHSAALELVIGEAKNRDGEQGYLEFEKEETKTFGTETVTITGLVNPWKLANLVHYLDETITWKAVVDGEEIALGDSGVHRVYVTLDTPGGKLASPRANTFDETGDDQIVTDARLERGVLAAWGTGNSDEQESVDAIFEEMRNYGIGYFLGTRWEPDPEDNTFIQPKPSLHHYLWLCNIGEGRGECHNIAASFALYCRIIGVKRPFAIGYMRPWPGREPHAPHNRIPVADADDPKSLGKLDIAHRRQHGAHGAVARAERVIFIDGAGNGNNFEGVLVYDDKALYAIGDDIFDRFKDSKDPDKLNHSASDYFCARSGRPDPTGDSSLAAYRTRPPDDLKPNRGAFELVFTSDKGRCGDPYDGKTGKKFRWEE